MRINIDDAIQGITIEEKQNYIVEVADTHLPEGIPASLIEAEGDIIVGLAPGVGMRLPAPTVDNQTLVSDLSVAGKWKLGTGTGGGGGLIALTNQDGSNAAAGSVVVAELTHDDAFKGTTIANDLSVIGVTAEAINYGAQGNVGIAALLDTLVTGNIHRGEWIAASGTKWRGQTAGYSKPERGAVGYALEEYTGGGNGTVKAVVMPSPYNLSAAGSGWALGGFTSVNLTDGQKFTIASATWATVVGAALGTATRDLAGLGYGTIAGYAIGGYIAGGVVTAHKMPFSTEVTATQSSANLPAARYSLRGGFNAADRGYVAGGLASNVVTKLTFATDTMSAALGTTLSTARAYPVGVSNGTYAYAQGGTGSGVSDLITVATDTVSDNNSGDVIADEYQAMSFPADNGYMTEKSGATNNSKKIVLSTGVSANVTSTLPADQKYASSVCDGSGQGWYSGDDASPYSVSHKFTKATETLSADAGAVMSVGKFTAGYFNNGAY